MPWIEATRPPGEVPAHYEWPSPLSDETILGKNIEYAQQKRKELGQLREGLLNAQNVCGKNKDIEWARYFREEAARVMKEYRGWDGAIKMIDDNDWMHRHITDQIAPYVDEALYFMDLQTTTNN
jgi:hypothetical protein